MLCSDRTVPVQALAANMGFRKEGDGTNGWSVDKVCDWLEDEELDQYVWVVLFSVSLVIVG